MSVGVCVCVRGACKIPLVEDDRCNIARRSDGVNVDYGHLDFHLKQHAAHDNVPMTIFYWVMGLLIAGAFTPSLLFFLLYLVQGEDKHLRRARGFWTATRLFGMFGANVLIWGHVVVGLWQIWFK